MAKKKVIGDRAEILRKLNKLKDQEDKVSAFSIKDFEAFKNEYFQGLPPKAIEGLNVIFDTLRALTDSYTTNKAKRKKVE